MVLVISWHFNAASIGEFSRAEFIDGMDDLSCDTIAKLKRKLPQLRAELLDPQKFKVRINQDCGISLGMAGCLACRALAAPGVGD